VTVKDYSQPDIPVLAPADGLRGEIFSMIRRRPVALEGISASLGIHQHEGRTLTKPTSERDNHPVIE